MRILLYINQVHPDEQSGQGSHERNLVAALHQSVKEAQDRRLLVVTLASPPPTPADLNIVQLSLNKNSVVSYLTHQLKLFLILFKVLWRHSKENIAIYARYSPTMVSPALLALLFKRRFVIRSGPALENLRGIYGGSDNSFIRFGVKISLWLNYWTAENIVVVTKKIGECVIKVYPLAKRKLIVSPNRVNVQKIQPVAPDRARWGLPQDAFVFGFVGYVYEEQGLQTIIRALSQLRCQGEELPYLLIVGDGPSLAKWQRLATDLGVSSNTIFTGQVAHEEIPSAICSCDIMLAPFTKDCFETKGSSALKLYEYLACDKPILASCGPDHEFIAAEGVGWLVNPEDIDDWSKAIKNRMQEGAVSLDGRARRLAEDNYSMNSLAETIWNICFPDAAAKDQVAITTSKSLLR
jgi:glycosyltransferase involved in cell wall biosynthesis